MIELYTSDTPNGWKVSIALEDLGLSYVTRRISILSGEHKSPEFLAINPNGRIPVIIDLDEGLTIFESGAILIHLAEKTGRLMGDDRATRSRVLQWLMFQVGGIGPTMGRIGIFPQRAELPTQHYRAEVHQLFSVLDGQFSDRDYVAGPYSIADIALFPWVRIHHWCDVPIADFPHLQRWLDRVEERPAVQRGVRVPVADGWEQATGGSETDRAALAIEAMQLVMRGRKPRPSDK